MDARTTSPAESQNSVIKSGSKKVTSNMSIDKSINNLICGIDARYKTRRNSAHTEFAKRSHSSRAPTKNFLIKKGQGLLDAQYDSRMEMKSAQIGPNNYLAWNSEMPLN